MKKFNKTEEIKTFIGIALIILGVILIFTNAQKIKDLNEIDKLKEEFVSYCFSPYESVSNNYLTNSSEYCKQTLEKIKILEEKTK